MSILKTKTVKGGATTVIEFDELSLRDIPGIMANKMGWSTAAALMNHWFNTSAEFKMEEDVKRQYMLGEAINIPKERYNDSIVKMDWALRYERTQDAMIELIDNRLENKSTNKRLFDSLLKRNKKLNPDRDLIYIGYGDDIINIDYTSQINALSFGDKFDTNDDFKGAIGAGNLELCIRGCYNLSGSRKIFYVDQIGFYIKDSYDFSGDYELLGIWSREGMLTPSEIRKYMPLYQEKKWRELYNLYKGYVPVFNKDFREWQNKHHSGGDFIVFSDVYWMDPPEHFKVLYEAI
ncbi:DUF6402 family protein [Xenorhabdus sp. PR6a]|uniref:DUF6402 family protein n=1 Tax=Xenorhabdus sp. PR6a TaxID=3025877 RepID=UPI0023599204|nr:DUF6402 family protein [Xenorhabdus sp. PR6a]MDC9583340.1 DUF6402 family protein [Xenorhabdus sp. PR6a]